MFFMCEEATSLTLLLVRLRSLVYSLVSVFSFSFFRFLFRFQ